MNILILQKTLIAFILVLWVIHEFREKKTKRSAPAIEEADARERHEWRYLRWGFRLLQIAATAYFITQLIQFLFR